MVIELKEPGKKMLDKVTSMDCSVCKVALMMSGRRG